HFRKNQLVWANAFHAPPGNGIVRRTPKQNSIWSASGLSINRNFEQTEYFQQSNSADYCRSRELCPAGIGGNSANRFKKKTPSGIKTRSYFSRSLSGNGRKIESSSIPNQVSRIVFDLDAAHQSE